MSEETEDADGWDYGWGDSDPIDWTADQLEAELDRLEGRRLYVAGLLAELRGQD